MFDPDMSYVHRTEDEAFPPLPPPHSPGQGGHEDREPFGNEEDDEGNVSKLDEVPAAKRKGVKRPQPKLDSQRLISARGLPALRTMFDDVHFKGKGHEAADLRLLMQKMENWAHRLFPKLQFEDFIDKVEKLGNKKEVQTCLKRIRLDMPLTHEDFGNEGEEEAAAQLPLFEDPDPFSGVSFSNEVQRPVHSMPAPAAPPPAAPPSLTEEQQRRMELNRQRALERRLARHTKQEADSDSQAVDTSADEPASVSSANVLNKSDEDEEGREPDSSSTQPPSQAPPTDPPSQTPPTDPPSQTPPTDPPTDPPSQTPPTDPPSQAPPSQTPPTDPPSQTPPTDPPSQTPPTDPEASAESSQCQEETSQQPISNEPEDTD